MVEIDPYDPGAIPVKRTAMGRMGHEACWISKAEKGKQLAFYMGDDARFEYIYKFVTKHAYDPATAGGFLLDDGTLYAAKFNDNVTGDWHALAESNAALMREIGSLAGMLVNTRSAADMVGATPMDRPEWGAVHPGTGEVFMILTNNSRRGDGNITKPIEELTGQDIGSRPPNPRAERIRPHHPLTRGW